MVLQIGEIVTVSRIFFSEQKLNFLPVFLYCVILCFRFHSQTRRKQHSLCDSLVYAQLHM